VGKQKRERVFCVVRDWCGTYALFILTTSGLIGKQYVGIWLALLC